jgi:hypothetical protein
MKSFIKFEFILENGSHSKKEILGCDTFQRVYHGVVKLEHLLFFNL